MPLTSKAKQALKAKAHKLKPVVLIGSKGLTPAVKNEIDIALRDHELIKVRIAASDKEEMRAIVDEIRESSKADAVQLIGKIGVFYKRRED